MSHASVPLYEAMSNLRAVRRLRPDPIPQDVLGRILQAATWAPSGGNTQPWRALVVQDAQLRSAIGDLYRPLWARYAGGYRARLKGLEGAALDKQERTLAAADYLGEHMGSAPVLVVMLFNPKFMAITDAEMDRPSVVGGGSIYPAVENLMLACVSEGIGCTLTTLLCYEEAAMKSLLAIPDDWHSCAVLPLGYPQGKGHGPITRKPVEAMCFADRFGTPYR
jgi:nitroreductase